MRDGQSSVMTLDLELTKAQPDRDSPENVNATAESSNEKEAISGETRRVSVDSFGKAVLAAASFYDQKNVTTRLEDAINSPEVMAIVVLNVSRVSGKDQYGPVREIVRIQSTVNSYSSLSARGLIIRFRRSWANPAAWLTALFLILSGILIFAGLQADQTAFATSGAIMLAILLGVWGAFLVVWGGLMLKEALSRLGSTLRGQKS